MARLLLLLLATVRAAPAAACDLALVFAIDVSNSVDEREYRLQVDGLSLALRDPAIADALLSGESALAVLQWSGADEQIVAVPWTRIEGPAALDAFVAAVHRQPRAFVASGTAPAEAVRRSLALLDEAPPCARRVIDVSGDGERNEGGRVAEARNAAAAAGVTINAITIETDRTTVSDFFRRELITPGGFVMRAEGHDDYPATLRAKIARELFPVVGEAGGPGVSGP